MMRRMRALLVTLVAFVAIGASSTAAQASPAQPKAVVMSSVSYQPIMWGSVKIGDRLTVYMDRGETQFLAGATLAAIAGYLGWRGIPGAFAGTIWFTANDAVGRSNMCIAAQYDVYFGWTPAFRAWVQAC